MQNFSLITFSYHFIRKKDAYYTKFNENCQVVFVGKAAFLIKFLQQINQSEQESGQFSLCAK